MKKVSEIKELQELVDRMKTYEGQEAKAAKTIERLNVVEVEEGSLSYTLKEDDILLNFNKQEFEKMDEVLKETMVMFLYASLKEGYNKRGEGVEAIVWNLATSLEFSNSYEIRFKDVYTPEMFGFEKNLSAEQYYDLIIDYREKVGEDVEIEIEIDESGKLGVVSEEVVKIIDDIVVI